MDFPQIVSSTSSNIYKELFSSIAKELWQLESLQCRIRLIEVIITFINTV